VWRGDDHREAEVWDVRHPSDVVLADGSVQTPVHRIQPVRVQVSGDAPTSVGTGSLTMIANGRLPQHGLD
jgi:hypothetical protein